MNFLNQDDSYDVETEMDRPQNFKEWVNSIVWKDNFLIDLPMREIPSSLHHYSVFVVFCGVRRVTKWESELTAWLISEKWYSERHLGHVLRAEQFLAETELTAWCVRPLVGGALKNDDEDLVIKREWLKQSDTRTEERTRRQARSDPRLEGGSIDLGTNAPRVSNEPRQEHQYPNKCHSHDRSVPFASHDIKRGRFNIDKGQRCRERLSGSAVHDHRRQIPISCASASKFVILTPF